MNFPMQFGSVSPVKDLVLDGLRAGLAFRGDTISVKMRAGIPFTLEMIANHGIIDEFIDSLADAESRQVISWLIRFRSALSLIGDKQIILNDYFPSQISQREYEDLLEQAHKLPEASLKDALDVDLIENFLLGGYALDNICAVQEGDSVFDLGVFNANSTIDFARRAGANGRVIGFEPNPRLSQVARENLEQMGLTALIEQMAVGAEIGELRFKKAGAASRIDPNGDISVPCTTLDTYIADNAIDKVDFIKLDIEGFEVPALKGMLKTIKSKKPKIAVCIYHLATDLRLIPTIIQECHPGYRFFVRHRARHDGEIVMFCVPS
jgi:FkbM family methyltransferase